MNDLTCGKESRQIFFFAFPMLIGNILQQMYNVIDSIIVGRFLGKEALAAVGASQPVVFSLISMIIGIATGCTIIIAQYFGARDMKSVSRTIDTMNIFLFFASIIMSVVGIIFSENIFRLISLPPEVIPQAKVYLQIFLTGTIFMFGFQSTSAILRGLGDSKTPLIFLAVSVIANIFLDLLFVVVFKWGIAGAAWATVLAEAGAVFSLVGYLNRNHKIIRFSFFNLEFDKSIFIKSIKIGLPTGFQQTFIAMGMMALFKIINHLGTDVAAAYSAACRIDSLAGLPATNFSAALSSFVGQNIGANKYQRVKTGLRSTLVMTSIISVMVSALLFFFPETVMHFFSTDPGVIAAGKYYLQIVAPFYILFSTMFVFAGVLRGAGDTLIPMFITLISLWLIRLPLAWTFLGTFHEQGIWWAIPIAWFMGTLSLYFYYLSGRWKKISVISNKL